MLWFIGATLCAYFIKGLCGFANTLVFSTILSFGVDNINISPVDLILGLWLGMKSSGKLNESIVKRIVIIALLLSGASLIISNLPI